MTSAYTPEQWRQLEDIIFDGSSAQLEAIRDYARANQFPPIALLVMCALRVLASLPAGTALHTGIEPPGTPNMIVMLIGYPGAGKDRTQSASSQIVTVTVGDQVMEPKELAPGSGEGIEVAIAAVQTDAGTTISPPPIMLGDSEGTALMAKMNRKDSTLRTAIDKLYSGNAMGTANKKETVIVPARSYTACLWSCAQWDTAHVFFAGDDDGLKHRLFWVEVIDPFAVLTTANRPKNIHPVALPADIKETGITFCQPIQQFIRLANHERSKGVDISEGGHTIYMRCKLAAGLALLSSRTDVTQADWEKAGALIDFSTAIEHKILSLKRQAEIMKEAEVLERKESAKTQLHINRRYRSERIGLTFLIASESFAHRELTNKARHYRNVAEDTMVSLAETGILTIEYKPNGKPAEYHRGPAWNTEQARERISQISWILPS